MEIVVKAHLVHSIDVIENFSIRVDDLNRLIVLKRMELEYIKAVDILKNLKKKEVIRSIFIPKNKKIQDKLDILVVTKKELKRSMRKIRDAFD